MKPESQPFKVPPKPAAELAAASKAPGAVAAIAKVPQAPIGC